MIRILILSLVLVVSIVAYDSAVCEDLIRHHCDKIAGDKAVDRNLLRETIREIVREEIRSVPSFPVPSFPENNQWTVFQRRLGGSVNFNRDWTDYVNGFGNKLGEFWLGLENLHQLTRNGHYELRIDMTEARTGRRLYANYSTFNVGPASDYYRLTATGYSGTATDSLGDGAVPERIHNGKRFSTPDWDRDNWYFGNCAARYHAGWWYDNCYDSNLNGVSNEFTPRGIVWVNQTVRSNMFMNFVEMKFRGRQ